MSYKFTPRKGGRFTTVRLEAHIHEYIVDQLAAAMGVSKSEAVEALVSAWIHEARSFDRGLTVEERPGGKKYITSHPYGAIEDALRNETEGYTTTALTRPDGEFYDFRALTFTRAGGVPL